MAPKALGAADSVEAVEAVEVVKIFHAMNNPDLIIQLLCRAGQRESDLTKGLETEIFRRDASHLIRTQTFTAILTFYMQKTEVLN